jgi:hypothetical protein
VARPARLPPGLRGFATIGTMSAIRKRAEQSLRNQLDRRVGVFARSLPREHWLRVDRGQLRERLV